MGCSEGLGASRHFRGRGVCRAPRREAPRAAAFGAGCRVGLRGRPAPGEAEEGKRQKVPRDTKVSGAGWRRSTEGQEGTRAGALRAPWRRGGCARVGARRRGRRGAALRGAETKIGAPSRCRVPPPRVGPERRWREGGRRQRPKRRGDGGGGGCQVLSPSPPPLSALGARCPGALAPLESSDRRPPRTPARPQPLACGFPRVLPLLLSRSWSGKRCFAFSWGGTFADDRMPELVVTLNCLELFSLPPTLSFLGSYSVTWPFTISFSSAKKKKKAKAFGCNVWRSSVLFMAMSPKDTLLVMVWHLFSGQISFLDTKVASFVGSFWRFRG